MKCLVQHVWDQFSWCCSHCIEQVLRMEILAHVVDKLMDINTYFVEICTTPFCCMFSSMTIEYGEEPLASNSGVIGYEGMGIFHRSPNPLIL